MAVKMRDLRGQIAGAAARSETALYDRRVDRVLNLLSDQQLIALAGDQPGAGGMITVESVDLPFAWEDDRVRSRVEALERQGITATVEERRKNAGGMDFHVWTMVLQYQDRR